MARTVVIVITLIIAINSSVYGQNQTKVDSLSRLLNSSNDSSKIDILINLCWAYNSSNPSKAIEYGNKALNISKKLNSFEAIASSLNAIGVVYSIRGNYLKALEYFLKVLDIRETLNDRMGIARTLNNIGIIYKNQNNYTLALEYYLKSLRIKEELNDTAGIAKSYNNIGEIYQAQNEYDKSLEYHFKSLEIEEKLSYKRGIASSLSNIATVYQNQNKNNEALRYHLKSLSIEEELGNKQGEVVSLNSIALLYINMGEKNKALKAAKKSLQIAKAIDNIEGVKYGYETLSNIYSDIGNYKEAYRYLKLYSIEKDTFFSREKSNQILELQAKYETAKKEHEIDLLKKDKLIKESELQVRDIIDYSLIAGLVMLLFFIVYYNISNRRIKRVNFLLSNKNLEINTQKEEISAQNLKLQQQSEEIKKINSYLAEQNEKLEELDQEKNNLMAIVAHDLKSPLNTVHTLSQLIEIDGELNEIQKESLSLITKVTEDGNKLINDLLDASALEEKKAPVNIETIELNRLLASLLPAFSSNAKKKEISIHFQNNAAAPSLNSDKTYIERIFENLLSNAVKFSPFNRNIYVDIFDNDKFISFTIRDEGHGLSDADKQRLFKKFQKLSTKPTGGEASSGLGLSIVKTLVEKLKGKITVETELNKGSSFIVTLPKKFNISD